MTESNRLTRLRSMLCQVHDDLWYTDGWHCIEITYEHPHVLRLWKQYDHERVLLHRLAPVPEDAEAMWHPQPCPSATLIVHGRYSMGVGDAASFDDEDDQPLVRQLTEIDLGPGSAYEMTNPDTWHVVQPSTRTYSIMLTGTPYAYANPVSPVSFPTPKSPGRSLEMDSDEVKHYMARWRCLLSGLVFTDRGSCSMCKRDL